MSSTASVRVLPAEDIAARAGGKTAPFRWPDRATYFAERSMRLRQLANGHAMGDFLKFASLLAQAQHQALGRLGSGAASIPIPDGETVNRAALAGLPPLSAADWARDPAWHGVLRGIVADVQRDTPAGPAADALARLAAADEVFLERQADALLTGVMSGLDLATAPVVAAALQVLWVHMTAELVRAHAARGQAQTQPVGKLDEAGVCPCCGSRPVTSITRGDGDVGGQRYLHCSLCGTEWHMPRVQCTHCGASGAEKVAYQSLDSIDSPITTGAATEGAGAGASDSAAHNERAAKAAIQAETCDACGHYLKIIHGDRDPLAEPVADDLASLTLDLLVAETGKQRHGVNLMLLFGDPGDAADAAGSAEPHGAPPGAH